MKCVIFDVDGTLADVTHRKHHLPNWDLFFRDMADDPPLASVVWLADRLLADPRDYCVVVVTARPENYRDVTQSWLSKHLTNYHNIRAVLMRKENDFRKDSLVKSEILQQITDMGLEPHLVVDDRPEVVEMWRSFGIPTLQCESDEVKHIHEGKTFLDMMVGPSGAGKSTYIEQNYKPCDVVSTDAIREMYGWGHSPEDLARTWNYVHDLIRVRTKNHIRTVLDATNIKAKDRLNVVKCVPRGQYVRYVVYDRDLDDKIRNRGWRPEELILKHHRTFQSQLKQILAGDDLSNIVVLDKRQK